MKGLIEKNYKQLALLFHKSFFVPPEKSALSQKTLTLTERLIFITNQAIQNSLNYEVTIGCGEQKKSQISA